MRCIKLAKERCKQTWCLLTKVWKAVAHCFNIPTPLDWDRLFNPNPFLGTQVQTGNQLACFQCGLGWFMVGGLAGFDYCENEQGYSK